MSSEDPRELTFFKFWDEECAAMSSFHFRLHLGHSLLISLYRFIMDCKMAENGVTPIPVAISTACSARKMLLAGAPKGPSIKILKKWYYSNIYNFEGSMIFSSINFIAPSGIYINGTSSFMFSADAILFSNPSMTWWVRPWPSMNPSWPFFCISILLVASFNTCVWRVVCDSPTFFPLRLLPLLFLLLNYNKSTKIFTHITNQHYI